MPINVVNSTLISIPKLKHSILLYKRRRERDEKINGSPRQHIYLFLSCGMILDILIPTIFLYLNCNITCNLLTWNHCQTFTSEINHAKIHIDGISKQLSNLSFSNGNYFKKYIFIYIWNESFQAMSIFLCIINCWIFVENIFSENITRKEDQCIT